jgi:hypothetical protein
MFEIDGGSEVVAREALRLAAMKQPVKCRFVQREDCDLPPEAPSFITRVCGFGFHILHRQFGQARRARSPHIAQAIDVLQPVSGFPAMSAV